MRYYRNKQLVITLQTEETATVVGHITHKGEAIFFAKRDRFSYEKPKHCSPINIVNTYTIQTKDGVRFISAETEEIALSVCPPNSFIKSVSSLVIDMAECKFTKTEQINQQTAIQYQYYRDKYNRIITLQTEETVTVIGHITHKGEPIFWATREQFSYEKPKHCLPINIVDSYTIQTKDGVRVINAETGKIALSVCPPNSVIKSVSSFVIDITECESAVTEQIN